jgi:hypothetical protein
MLGKIDAAHANAAQKMLQRRDDDPRGTILWADSLRLALAHRMLR